MSEISQLHDLAELCKKMDNPVSMSANSIIAISAECDALTAERDALKAKVEMAIEGYRQILMGRHDGNWALNMLREYYVKIADEMLQKLEAK